MGSQWSGLHPALEAWIIFLSPLCHNYLAGLLKEDSAPVTLSQLALALHTQK
jgi:hypothetical protein